jgi:hypothetical protein
MLVVMVFQPAVLHGLYVDTSKHSLARWHSYYNYSMG